MEHYSRQDRPAGLAHVGGSADDDVAEADVGGAMQSGSKPNASAIADIESQLKRLAEMEREVQTERRALMRTLRALTVAGRPDFWEKVKRIETLRGGRA